MGKAARLKVELEDVSSLLEILTVLKDVSSNRFFVYAGKKINYQKFIDIFVRFFEMLSSSKTDCPLIKNNHPGIDILVLTSEQGFMSQLNSRVSALALEEYNKSPLARLICLGNKGADKCRSMGMKIEKIFPLPPDGDRNELSSDIRHYLIDRIMTGKTGKVVIANVWAKSLGVLKPHVIELLPISDVHRPVEDVSKVDSQSKLPPKVKKDFIHETDSDSIALSLANAWVHMRIFEVVNDLQIVEAAAQATQLESAIEGLSGERKLVILNYRKAVREELNAAMRGVITSTNMTKAKARAKAKVAA